MDDEQRQRLMIALVAFNLTIVIYQVVFNMGLFGFTFSAGKLMLGLLLAAAVGAGGYFAAGMRR
jgi:hypothetical protein